MAADLGTTKLALANLTRAELQALLGASNHVPQIVPGLLAWISTAADWELDRRQGFEHELSQPDAAMLYEEEAVSIEAARALRARFVDAPTVRALFDALLDLLAGGSKRKHGASDG